MIRLWTDGACTNQRRKGGWAFIAESKGHVLFEGAGPVAATTSNRMELQAAIEALRWGKQWAGSNHLGAEVISDSRYLVNGAERWLAIWKARGWRLDQRNGGGEVKNMDLWEDLDELIFELAPKWRWVRGHNGTEFNERADKLAQEASRHGTVLRQPGQR